MDKCSKRFSENEHPDSSSLDQCAVVPDRNQKRRRSLSRSPTRSPFRRTDGDGNLPQRNLRFDNPQQESSRRMHSIEEHGQSIESNIARQEIRFDSRSENAGQYAGITKDHSAAKRARGERNHFESIQPNHDSGQSPFISEHHGARHDFWRTLESGQAKTVDRRAFPREGISACHDYNPSDASARGSLGITSPDSSVFGETSCEHTTLACVANKIRVAQRVDTANKDIAAFLGGTGVGKTTTINFCCDAPMVRLPNEDRYDNTVRIDVCPEKREMFPSIGHGQSMTKSIQVFTSPAKKNSLRTHFCDMPGSSDDRAADKIINCILRSQALRGARSVRPVLVIKLKDFEGNRYQNSRAMIEFVAGCFRDESYFDFLMVLVTFALDDDESTLGRLRYHLGKLKELSQDENTMSVPAYELLLNLQSEVDAAVKALEKHEDNLTRIRVVRPLVSKNRASVLQCIENGRRISDPVAAFSFHLESDAGKIVDSFVSAEHQKVCRWLSEGCEFGRIGPVLVDLDVVGGALGRDLLKASRGRVLLANDGLFNDIKQAVLSLLNAPLESLDVSQLGKAVDRFRAMQVITQSAGNLLPSWKTVECLIWDYQKDLELYIDVERAKSSWEALDGCAFKVELLDTVLACENARDLAQDNVLQALMMHSNAAFAFAAPADVSESLTQLRRARDLLTGNRKERAAELYRSASAFLYETLVELLQKIVKAVHEMEEESEARMSDDQEAALFSDVTKLFKFTRPDQRIDEFLPEEAQSSSEGGFYGQFRESLRLDQVSGASISRNQLLKHANLLACLMKVEDDELRMKIQLHMDNLRNQIDNYLKYDFQRVQDSFNEALPADTAGLIDFMAEQQVDAAAKFNTALLTAGELLQIDEINRDKVCADEIAKFFEGFEKRVKIAKTIVSQGLYSPTSLIPSTLAYILCRDINLSSLKALCNAHRQHGLCSRVEELQRICAGFCNLAHEKAIEECRSIDNSVQCSSFDFGSEKGLRAADGALVRLEILSVIVPADATNLQMVLQRQYEEFVSSHVMAFQAQEGENPRAMSVDVMLDAFSNLLPASRAEGLLRLVPKDRSLLDSLVRGIGRAEASQVALADERLSHTEVDLALRNIRRLLQWKRMDESNLLGSEMVGLKDARDALMQKLDRGLQEAKAALEHERYDAVADFASQCPEVEKSLILSDATHSFRAKARIIRRRALQMGWLAADQIHELGETFEGLEECIRSRLFRLLDQTNQTELSETLEQVRKELSVFMSKFRDVLAQRILKKAFYGECDTALNVIVGLKFTFPECFREASQIFEDHVKAIQGMFDDVESADDVRLQQLAVDVVEIMSDLNVHGVQSAAWRAFDDAWRSLRGVMDPKVSSIVSILKSRARALLDSEQGLELARKMLETHGKVLEYAVKAGYPPNKFADTVCEMRAVAEMQRINAETFRASLRRGDFEAAVRVKAALTDEERSEARRMLEEQVRELKRDTEDAAAGSGSRGKLTKGVQHLQRLKSALENSRSDPHLLADVEYFLREIGERCDAMIAEVCAELEKLSGRDVIHPLGAWVGPLERAKKIIEFPSDLTSSGVDDIVGYVLIFGSKLHDTVQKVIQAVREDSRGLELHLLKRVWENMDRDEAVLRLMEDVMKWGQGVVAVNLSGLCADSKENLLQILLSKSHEAAEMVENGIQDKVLLSKILSTLQQAANEQFSSPLDGCEAAILKILEQRVAQATGSWEMRDVGWSDQLNSIVRTFQAGQGAFAEVKALFKLVSDALDTVLRPIRVEIDGQCHEVASCRGGTGEIAQSLLQIRAMAGDVDMLHDYTKQAIRDLLVKLQAARAQEASFLCTLGEALAASDDPLGKALIMENAHVFQRLSNMLYNQHMKDKATLDIKQVLKNMCDSNPNGGLDCDRLEVLYTQFLGKYSILITKYIKNTTKPLQLRENELVSALGELVRKKQQVDLVDYLAHLSALFSFCKSAQYYGSGADESCIVKPHEIQVSSILRLLSMDQSSGGVCRKIFNGLFGAKPSRAESIANHFMQIPTGEGKSIVLGITACIFALQGWHVDCVCYSKYLSGRDESDFKDMFRLLKRVSCTAGEIRYMTFEDLCESHIEGVREAVQDVIYGKDVSATKDPTRTKRVLLIDEADVFFTKRFYGNKHCPGFRLKSPEIMSLIRHIWESRRAPPSEDALLSCREYQDVIARFACVEPIVRQSALAMLRNVQDVNNPKFEWTFNKGQLGYLVAGEFVSATAFSHQNRTVFAFLKEHESRNPHVDDAVLDDMVGIDIKCGEYSYAALPKRYYSKIFGVTGTLETLSKEERELLREEYGVTKETVVPSAYGNQRLRLDFRFEEQHHVMVADNESEWSARIEKEVEDSVAVGRSVLVLFKNDRALQGYVAARPRHGAARRLDANVEDADLQYINGIVANATLPGRVTLLTRKYGRGLDFKPSKAVNASGGVMVVQTFYSSAESEQIQVMGRTARQGEKGLYRLIMCSEHLQAKMGFVYQSGMSNQALKEGLEAARRAKMRAKFDGRAKLRAEADKADARSWELATALYGPGAAANKLRLLNSLSLSAVGAMTFVLLLDVSGSMHTHYKALLQAFDAFATALREGGHADAGSLVSVILFESKARVLFSDRRLADLGPLFRTNPCGGGTSFSAAFELCHQELAAARARDAARRFVVLFMTDGEDDAFDAAQLLPMVQDLGPQVASFSGISFGDGASGRLEAIAAAFVAGGSGTRARVVTPRDAAELVEAFAAAGGDAALRMR